MAFTDAAALAADPVFIARVKIALLTGAVAVMAEDNSGVYWHARKTYALACLRDPEGQAALAAWAVVTNGAITGASVDGDVAFTVNSMFDALAGSAVNT